MGIASTIATGLSIGECMYMQHVCIAHPDPKASEQEEQKSHLQTGVFDAGEKD